jgi:hypothetical protein
MDTFATGEITEIGVFDRGAVNRVLTESLQRYRRLPRCRVRWRLR